jgi:membrane associated rhomboid family serine protease
VTQQPAGTGEGVAVPHCYRHPDRETYISCARCGRAVCPDCMHDAPVGFQCPDCVRQGAAKTPVARTVFGGRAGGDPGWVSKGIIAICVVLYLLQTAGVGAITRRLEMFDIAVADGQYYRLLTAAFLHAGLFHILFNMYAVWIFGPPLEQLLGRARFAALYLLAALGGSATSYLFSPLGSRSVGASGAIFGLLGAFLVINRRMNRDSRGLIGLLVLNAVIGFLYANIDWRAHVGGFVTGLVVAAIFAYAPRQRRTLVQVAGCAVVLAVIAVMVVVETSDLRAMADFPLLVHLYV